MSNRKNIRAVALLARPPGLAVLRECLIDHPRLDLAAIFTHGRDPKAEGGGLRREWPEFQSVCVARGIPLTALDGAEAKALETALPDGRLDLLISLSWRYIVSGTVLRRFGIGAVNLHRGALPEYPGAEPVRRAIEAGERRVAITAHHMSEEIDAGAEIARVWLDVDPTAEDAEGVKTRLVPLYAPLAALALDAVLA